MGTQLKAFVFFGAALAALVFAASPASAGPLISDASLVCAQTPADAAGDASNPQITPDDPNPGTTACADLCKKWVGTCKGAVAAMKGCWLKVVGKVGALRNRTCKELDGASKDNCLQVVKAERDFAKDTIRNLADTGRGICEGGGLANCLLNCS